MTQKMKIEVWTDIMCPYCHIGKALYEKALRTFPHAHEVEVEWKAFQLNPDLPDNGQGYPVTDYLLNTMALPPENIETMFRNVEHLATDAGVKFNLRNAIAANTRDAHRLIKLAAKKGTASTVVSLLSNAYFEEAKDYSNHRLLIEIGEKAGLQRNEIVDMLASDNYVYEVIQDMQEAANLGFDTVPTFLFDRKQAVIGSEPLEVFAQTLEKAYNDWKKPTTPNQEIKRTKGHACNADGTCEIG